MSNIKTLQQIYDILTDTESCAENIVAQIGEILSERPDDPEGVTDGQAEDCGAIHGALMHGLEELGINYESDGDRYWIDCADGNTRYVDIGLCDG